MNERTTGKASADVVAHLRSRKEFLRLAAAAGLGTTLGANVLLSQAFSQPVLAAGSSISPAALRFSTKSQYRPFDVISKNFVEHSDTFDTDQGLYTSLAPAPPGNTGSVSIGGGVLSVNSSDKFFALLRTTEAPVAPYASVIVDVKTFVGAARREDTVYAGLVRDASNYVAAWYNNVTKKVGIDAVVGGKVNRLVVRDATLTAPVRFAFVINSKEVTALADTGGPTGTGSPWKPLANYPNNPEVSGDPAISPGLSQYVDLRDPAVLSQYTYGFGVRGDRGTIALDKVEAGYWGRAGVRDPHVVTWADGTPYIKNNKLYLTLTNAGLDFFATAHWGVYTLDLSNYASPNALEEVGKIYSKRDGKVFGDHAGHIVYDDATDNFLIGVSTWGDFTYNGVHVNYTTIRKSQENVLHGVHVIVPQKLNLPTVSPTDTGTWDPHFVRIGGEWYVAFVDSPTQGSPWKHFPALAKGPDLEHLSLVGAESDLQQTEGMVMQKVGGKWYVLCSSGRGEIQDEDAGSATYRIYLPESDGAGGLKFFGKLKAPYVTNIPHPMITPLPVDGNTKWIMVTFDGTMYYEPILGYGTHGDFYVMDGSPLEGGYEFPPRDP